MQAAQLTTNEIESMRALVAQHDQSHSAETKEFDLNNPPKIPYRHQDLPRLVYHHGKRAFRPANTVEELAAALEAGWQKEPFGDEPEAPLELDPESAREAAAADAKLRSKRK